MLHKIIESALKNRALVLLLFAIAAGAGAWRLSQLPIDAFPDTTPVQVQVNTTAPALNPLEIEQQVTLPLELAISGLPGLANVRSVSKFGFSQLVATFDDETDIYDARQFVMERLSGVDLPDGIDPPRLGPIATGLGEVFHYIVASNDPKRSLTDLRTIHDWVIKPELLKAPGVAEVNSWGGFEKQYHVVVDPDALIKYGLTLGQVHEALERNNQNVGGGQIDRAGESLLVHGVGRTTTMDAIGAIVLAAHHGQPVHVRDVAEVREDHEIRRGAVSYQGEGEAVLGLGFMLMGENSAEVAAALRKRVEAVRAALPDDVTIEIVYDRTDLVHQVIDTVKHNLVAGAILVVLVLFALLGNLRAGILVAITIPLCMLYAALGMYELSIAASLLSLGAVDFGIIVDGSVVMTEANLRRLRSERERHGRRLTRDERFTAILESSREVARPIVFGMGIIVLVFFPILTLEGIEAKMFKPMAWTFIFALAGAFLAALVLSPVLSYYFLPREVRPERRGPVYWLTWLYGKCLSAVLSLRWAVVPLALGLATITALAAVRLGGEFIPRLSEGAVVANVIRLAGVSIDSSTRYNTRIEQLLLEAFPDEIDHVWSRIGSAEVATDPMGLELTDIFITLRPREHWRAARDQAGLTAAISRVLDDLPGVNIAYTQPIEMRLNEMVSGLRSDVGIKIIGDDFDELVRLSDAIQQVVLQIEGAADLSSDQITGQPTIVAKIDQAKIARNGIAAKDALDFIEAVGGIDAGEIYEGQRVFPLVLRLPDSHRTSVDKLSSTIVPTEFGPRLELRQIADIVEVDSPSTINREWGRRLIRVQTNVRDRDVASFVREAKERIEEEVPLPEGYVLEWGGQFENLERARLRLAIIVPITLLLVFFLLYFSLKSLRDVLIIYTGIPFAAVGGIFALWMRGMPFSVSAAVGFIALSGIAVLNGQVLVAAIRTFVASKLRLREAVLEAAKQRLRPVLATAITDAAGFIPMAISSGVGAEVQRPLATVVVGGILTATVLTLFVLPPIYLMTHRDDRDVKSLEPNLVSAPPD